MRDIYHAYFMCGFGALIGAVLTGFLQRDSMAEESRRVLDLHRWGCILLSPAMLPDLSGDFKQHEWMVFVLTVCSAGAALIGMALREFYCKPLPKPYLWLCAAPAFLLLLAALTQDARGWCLAVGGVYALLGGVQVLDHFRQIRARASFTASELSLFGLLFAFMAVFLASWLYGLNVHAETYPTHGLLLPDWAIPYASVGLSVMPLTSSALVFLVVNDRLVRRLEGLVLTDPLTGMLSRRGFGELGTLLMSEHQRRGQLVGVLMIDIDHFKQVNDTHGHHVGDLALKHVSEQLSTHLRGDALLARYGGEEFTALVPVSSEHEVSHVAERLRQAIENKPCSIPDGHVKLTASFGVSVLWPDSEFDDVIQEADARLYRAKQSGRNMVIAN